MQHDANKIKKRFLALNRDRLMRTRDALRPRQREVMDVLPLLFHANHPIFPGYVSKNTPMGVSDYAPARRTLDAVKKLVRSFEFKNRALPRYDIHALFLMGSTGTIAYSAKSDFDIWLCHNPDLSAVQLAELQEKANAIEKWTTGFDLEVHFFLMNADKFRQGKGIDLSVESSGSAQHHLLLEEFYRTGLLLAGRYPIWWLVPPEEEANYGEYSERLKRWRVVRDNETIDFGGLPQAPAEEFFGGAVWQLYKGIDSPYKAALKLMLMEVYAAEYPRVDLLSQRFKRDVHAGQTDLSHLDPYIMLYEKIEEHLLAHDDYSRLELIRRCFYFKVNENLGRPDNPRLLSWRREVMREMTRAWNWDEGYLQLLDSRPHWKIHRVLDERKELVSALTQSYHSLSNFAREHALLAKINQRDLNVLGRKLYAAFERKAGKIDIANIGISEDLWESHLTLFQVGGEQDGGWLLYRGTVAPEEVEHTKPLKRTHGIVEMIAWCHLNKLVDDRTAIALHARHNALALGDIRALITFFRHIYPDSALEATDLDSLARPPKAARIAILINVGAEPGAARIREGKFLTSNKVDALSYGGVCENHIMALDLVVQTTWQEILAFRYEGERGLFECLSAYIKWAPPSQGHAPPRISAQCFSAGQSGTITRRVEELFSDVVSCYYSDQYPPSTRYLLVVEQRFYALRLENDALLSEHFASYQDLLRYLARPQPAYSPLVIDRHALTNDVLPAIYRNNTPGTVQVYFAAQDQMAAVYIVDERGSLFYTRMPQCGIEVASNHYKRFLDAVLYRRNIQHNDDEDAPEGGITVEIYQAAVKTMGKSQIARYQERRKRPPERYFNIQVIGDASDGEQPFLTVYCDDGEFSSLEYGERLYEEIAMRVLEKRQSRLLYPIYITDLDISHKALGIESSDQLQTIHLLEYKRNFEERLNQALAILVERHTAKTAR